MWEEVDQSDCVAKVTAICASSLNRKKKGSQTGDELVFLSSAPIAVSLDDKRVSPMFFVVDWWCNNFGFFSLSRSIFGNKSKRLLPVGIEKKRVSIQIDRLAE